MTASERVSKMNKLLNQLNDLYQETNEIDIYKKNFERGIENLKVSIEGYRLSNHEMEIPKVQER